MNNSMFVYTSQYFLGFNDVTCNLMAELTCNAKSKFNGIRTSHCKPWTDE